MHIQAQVNETYRISLHIVGVYLRQVLGLEYGSYVSPPPGNKRQDTGAACAQLASRLFVEPVLRKTLDELISSFSPVSLACLVLLCQQRKTGWCLFPSLALVAGGLVR